MSTENSFEEHKDKALSQYAVSGWHLCKDKLPKEQICVDGVWKNEQLLLIKWDKHDSLELGVLTRINGILIWEIPNFSTVNLYEVSQWMYIPACH
jgi:hypothetical protein